MCQLTKQVLTLHSKVVQWQCSIKELQLGLETKQSQTKCRGAGGDGAGRRERERGENKIYFSPFSYCGKNI